MKESKIKMVFFDIDGVLTDGCAYVDPLGGISKRYRLTEIDALNDIKKMGFKMGAITGEDTEVVGCFKNLVEWDVFVKGCKNKLNAITEFAEGKDIFQKDICYIGDGKYDIEPIMYVGLGVCPANAIQEVKDVANIVLEGSGGESCIYELYQLLKKMKAEEKDGI